MDSLKTKLYPHRFHPVQFGQKRNYFVIQAVRPCPDGKGNDFWMGDCFRENLLQIFHRCVCVSICLEIGNIPVNRALGGQNGNLTVDLFRYRKGNVRCKISASAFTAENAASVSNLSVTVRAGHAAV